MFGKIFHSVFYSRGAESILEDLSIIKLSALNVLDCGCQVDIQT